MLCAVAAGSAPFAAGSNPPAAHRFGSIERSLSAQHAADAVVTTTESGAHAAARGLHQLVGTVAASTVAFALAWLSIAALAALVFSARFRFVARGRAPPFRIV